MIRGVLLQSGLFFFGDGDDRGAAVSVAGALAVFGEIDDFVSVWDDWFKVHINTPSFQESGHLWI